VINGTKYLLKDTTNHLIIVPTPPAEASVDAQSITPVDLSKNSFVTPSITKASQKKRPSSSSSSIVLAKHKCSNSCSASDESSVVYVRAKKKNETRTHKKTKNKKSELLDLVLAADSSSGIDDEVTMVEKPAEAATLEVETEVETQLLPQTDDFGQSKVADKDNENICDEDENISNLSHNLLEDDNDE
jgi:hypothetical protein